MTPFPFGGSVRLVIWYLIFPHVRESKNDPANLEKAHIGVLLFHLNESRPLVDHVVEKALKGIKEGMHDQKEKDGMAIVE